MDLSQYIQAQALILLPVLWVVGSLLKKTPVIKDWCIPWILLGVSVLGAVFLLGFSVQSVVQGVLVAGASVFGHQLVKQTLRKDED